MNTGAIKGVGQQPGIVIRQMVMPSRTTYQPSRDRNVAGTSLSWIMDVWEHAFIKDYVFDRLKYIEAFFANIN